MKEEHAGSSSGEPALSQATPARVRRAARLAAVQALYQIAVTGAPAQSVIEEFLLHRFGKDEEDDDASPIGTADRGLFAKVVHGVSRRRDEIDSMIAPNLAADWSMERLQPVLMATLRAGVYEFLACPEVPPRVVINEYIDIAHAFFEDKEAAFVNAILDRLAHELREGDWENEKPAGSEFERIARYFAPLAKSEQGALGLLDDAAILEVSPGKQLVVAADALVAGVHFMADDDPGDVARKLLRVNLSDLAAMGAVPRTYLLVLALPEDLGETWFEAFSGGLKADHEAYGLTLLGGDTVATQGPLTLSATIFGETPIGGEVRRSGARPGSTVFCSGSVGDAALGLMVLQGEIGDLRAAHKAFLIDRYRLPRPRSSLGPLLPGLAEAAVDVSDGIVADLAHLCRASAVGAEIDSARLPLSEAAEAMLRDDPRLIETVLGGGDDYEIVFTVPRGCEEDVAALSERLDLRLTAIGRVVKGRGVKVFGAEGDEMSVGRPGYIHFSCG